MSTPRATFEFRPHLDGLRALAVLAVFAFHAAPPALRGGFIGVDVFFVLSGFLITSILLIQSASGGVSLKDFYIRRIKRLLPASIVLLLTVVVVTAVFAPTVELRTRLSEVRATAFYVANWNLIGNSDNYFAEDFSASPLRHMWSLAVEEQFYFVWPIALVGLLALFRRRTRWVVAIVAVVSVVSVVRLVTLYSPATVSRAYYGTDSRVFQPLLGAALALVLHGRRGAELPAWARRTSVFAAPISLLCLVWLARLMNGTEPAYFRWGAFVAALAAVALIAAGEAIPHHAIFRFLSWTPLVRLGAISYGFYLWHWPIIQWVTVPEGADFLDRRLVNGLQFALSLAAAVASYTLVERPIKVPRISFRSAMAGAAGSMLIVVAAAAILLRVPGDPVADAAYADRSYQPCPDNPQPCVKVEGAGPDAPTVVLIGDSTAQAYDPALQLLAEKYGFRYVQAAVGGCPIGHRLLATGLDGELHKSSNFMCFDETPGIYERVVDEFDADLILATSWNETNSHVTDGRLIESQTPEHLAETRLALDDAVDILTSDGAQLVFIDVLPPGPSVSCLEQDDADTGSCVRSVLDPSPEDPYNAIFADLARERDDVLAAISFRDELCPDGACPLTIDNVVVRYDGGHFTGTQSRALAPGLEQRLTAAGIELAALAAS